MQQRTVVGDVAFSSWTSLSHADSQSEVSQVNSSVKNKIDKANSIYGRKVAYCIKMYLHLVL